MKTKRPTETELLKGLDAEGTHSDELADMLPEELDLQFPSSDSAKEKNRLSRSHTWDEYFDEEPGCTDDFMGQRDQPKPRK
ncbi:antitoxin VapB [Tamilnaduibacter salinus]|uniref:Antitoxin VapB n=1 Tax=Tamilnaduibacter salinus TaxID=1484056 RepID=A0A2U1CXC7_9GAMM|nr:antitoxin VapB [Tamilnaduibacter salinus]